MDKKEKLLNELKQLRSMNQDDAIEVMKGYHKLFHERIADSMEELRNIAELSPATFRLTKTAVIIAESDFFSEDKLNHLYIEGHKDDLVKLLTNVFKQMPEEFAEVVKNAGYVKA